MEQQIYVVAELTIADGKIEEFKSQMSAIIELVKTNEPDMTGYQLYLNDDQTKCYVIEWLKNSRAWLTHLSNVAPAGPGLFAIAPITRFEIYGNISKDVEDVVKPMGAVVYRRFAGFIK